MRALFVGVIPELMELRGGRCLEPGYDDHMRIVSKVRIYGGALTGLFLLAAAASASWQAEAADTSGYDWRDKIAIGGAAGYPLGGATALAGFKLEEAVGDGVPNTLTGSGAVVFLVGSSGMALSPPMLSLGTLLQSRRLRAGGVDSTAWRSWAALGAYGGLVALLAGSSWMDDRVLPENQQAFTLAVGGAGAGLYCTSYALGAAQLHRNLHDKFDEELPYPRSHDFFFTPVFFRYGDTTGAGLVLHW